MMQAGNTRVVISGVGLFTPPESVSNRELVESFNAWVDHYNTEQADAIAAGDVEPQGHSNVEFIEKASGIKSRFVMNKAGIIDPLRMLPRLEPRSNDEPSVMCEIGVAAAKQAMEQANVTADDIDAVLVAASNMERAYPAIAIEVQAELGIKGFAFDMNVACSSATFGIQQAYDMVVSGNARRVLMVNPEICTGHLNFRDRDSHFIFGDVATAVVIEAEKNCQSTHAFEILDTKLQTIFSNNIRNNFGFLNRATEEGVGEVDKLFVQEGRKVFREVCPAVAEQITNQLAKMNIEPDSLKRIWLHQANRNMNELIAKKILGREPTDDESPTILDQYANTSSAGSVIAFKKYNEDFEPGDLGVLSSFGAGYSIGSIVLKRI